MNLEYAIIVVSCDKYKDTWEPFFKCLSMFWPNNTNSIYLITNDVQEIHIDNIIVINTGPETSWSSKVRKAIPFIKEDYFLLLLDDYFLVDMVDNHKIDSLFTFARDNNGDYISLVPSKYLEITTDHFASKISSRNLYGKTLQPAIWKKEYLNKCLYGDEFSAWEFENRQKIHFPTKIEGRDYCVLKKVLRFKNGVLQGKWYPSSIRSLKKIGIEINLDNRDILPIRAVIKYRFRVHIANIVPISIIRRTRKLMERLGFTFVTKG